MPVCNFWSSVKYPHGVHAFPDECYVTRTKCKQDGDLSNYLKAQGGQLLPEDAIMLHFVQICLAIQYIHSKVSSMPCWQPHTRGSSPSIGMSAHAGK